jgi:signal transduction histidine kinase
MLHEFLTENRSELLSRCAARVEQRHAPKVSHIEMHQGMPLFLDQLIETLEADERMPEPERHGRNSMAPDKLRAGSEMGVSASQHGRELVQGGFTVDEVVRDYGDLCQEITGLAMERGVPIQVDEFRTLNRCLDNGIADAVTEFTYQRDALMAGCTAESLNERLGFLAHELRNLIQRATLAITVIKTGRVGLAGATGGILDNTLVAMSSLVDRSLAEVRLNAGMPLRYQLISVADFISDVKISASLEADTYQCRLSVSVIDPTLAVDADRDMLFSAVGNLLQNAFKFTAHRSEVRLNAYADADRILITVEDSGVGLAPGEAERIFLPFTQSGADKSGVGLGLAICRRSTEINNGILSVRNVPGSGCVFTINLPRHTLPKRSWSYPLDGVVLRKGT